VLAQDVPEQLVNGTSPKLTELRRQFAAWGEALDELPDTDLPTMLRTQSARFSDNWRPLFNIAALAGGGWPALLTEAIEAELHEEMRPTCQIASKADPLFASKSDPCGGVGSAVRV
jgi:hypothetical protein